MSPPSHHRIHRAWGPRAALLVLCLSAPALAAEQEVDGLIIGKTPCAEAIRMVHARDRERVEAATDVPGEDSMEVRGLRIMLKKPQGDRTPYKALYAEQSRRYEAQDLEKAAKGPDVRGLNTEECNPFGYMGPHEMVAKALSLKDPVQVDVAALGEKKCPYGSDFISVGAIVPHERLLCLGGTVGVYSKLVSVEMPKLRQELATKLGTPKGLGISGLTIDTNTMTISRFQEGASFRQEEGLVVLSGFGEPPDGPIRVKQKGYDFLYKDPAALTFDAKTEVLYMSRAAVDTLERDQKLYDALAAKAAARKKKKRR